MLKWRDMHFQVEVQISVMVDVLNILIVSTMVIYPRKIPEMSDLESAFGVPLKQVQLSLRHTTINL